MFATPYRRFSPREVRAFGARGAQGFMVLARHTDDPPLELSPLEYRLAQLYDGMRSPAQLLAAARAACGTELTGEALEMFAAELALVGALQAGSAEPLPVPRLTEEARQMALHGVDPAPPSTMPGSLAGPGMMEGLLGLVTDGRGQKAEPWFLLSPGLWVAFGPLLNVALASRARFATLLGVFAFAVFGLWQRHLEVAVDFLRLAAPGRVLLLLGLGFVLIQLFTHAARAAAISSYAGSTPQIGVRRSRFWLPVVDVDSGGAVLRADRGARTRIVASGISAMLMLFLAAAFLWLLSRGGASAVVPYSLGIGAMALFTMLIRLNPLVRRDGYFLLAQHLGVPDLREQVFTTLLGYPRIGWAVHQRPISKRRMWIFAGLSLANTVLLLVMSAFWASLVSRYFGGTGFFLFVVFLGVIVSQTFRSGRPGGGNRGLGQAKQKPWWQLSRKTWIALAILAVLCVLPYRFHPSGDFVVLPQARADVRALIAGDVREVLVKEGDVVAAGQPIARISDDQEVAQIAGSEARLAQLKADLSLVKKGNRIEEVEVAQSAVATATKRAQVSAAQAARLNDALKKKSVTASDYDRARGVADVDQKALEEARSRLALVKSPAVEDRLAALEAQVRQAEAELKYHQQQLTYTQVTAPIAGRVVSGSLMFARGSFLNRGDLLAQIEDSGQRLAEVKLPETAIGEIKVGSKASTKAWAFPGSAFDGEVKALAPSVEQGPYGRVVRVQVSINDPDNRLLPGMTGNAKVSGEWHMAIVVFSRAVTRFFLVEVWSWIP